MNSLIGNYTKSQKADSFRPDQSPNKYNDGIAALNALGDNQAQKINTQTINRIGKNQAALASTTNGNPKLPGISQ